MSPRRREVEWLDLGDGHTLSFFRWAPDDLPANRARYGVPLPRVARAGAIIRHSKPDGTPCEGAIHFALPETEKMSIAASHRWQVESWQPLTLSPSVLCACGDHGFIRDGRWVRA